MLEKTLESPLDSKEMQLVNPKGIQSWKFIERTDAEAETPILWPPCAKNWFIGKDLDAGKDWRQEMGVTEDEMVGWHHQLNGHEFEQTPGVGDEQRGLACCSPWDLKESNMTATELNWTDVIKFRSQMFWKCVIDGVCEILHYFYKSEFLDQLSLMRLEHFFKEGIVRKAWA